MNCISKTAQIVPPLRPTFPRSFGFPPCQRWRSVKGIKKAEHINTSLSSFHLIHPLEVINIDANRFFNRGVTDIKQHKKNAKNVLKCYFNYRDSAEKRRNSACVYASRNNKPLQTHTQASEESQLISSAVCQQRGPDASRAAARGANERRREHLPFKPGDVVLLFNTQGFCCVPFLPPGSTHREKERHCRFKRFSVN